MAFAVGETMKRFTTLFTFLVFATAILGVRASSQRPDGGDTVATSRPDGRRLVWSDEFDGSALDSTKWQVWGTMSSTDNIYTNDERTVQVAEGRLRLHVLPSGVTNKVAMLPRGLVTRDRMAFRYGYLEMRARVPYRHGAWPSFWLQSAPPPLRKADWMSEIDVLESFASSNAAVANLHKWRGKDHVMLPGGEGSPKRAYLFPHPETLNDEFHVYAMEWTPEAISFLVDGERFMTVPIDEAHDFAPKPLAGMAGFHDPHYVIFNNEIFTPGHGWCPEDKRLRPEEDTLPIDYEIDWVRLWQKEGEEFFLDAPRP